MLKKKEEENFKNSEGEKPQWGGIGDQGDQKIVQNVLGGRRKLDVPRRKRQTTKKSGRICQKVKTDEKREFKKNQRIGK